MAFLPVRKGPRTISKWKEISWGGIPRFGRRGANSTLGLRNLGRDLYAVINHRYAFRGSPVWIQRNPPHTIEKTATNAALAAPVRAMNGRKQNVGKGGKARSSWDYDRKTTTVRSVRAHAELSDWGNFRRERLGQPVFLRGTFTDFANAAAPRGAPSAYSTTCNRLCTQYRSPRDGQKAANSCGTATNSEPWPTFEQALQKKQSGLMLPPGPDYIHGEVRR